MPIIDVTYQPGDTHRQTTLRRALAIVVKRELRAMVSDTLRGPDPTTAYTPNDIGLRLHTGDREDENVSDLEIVVAMSPGDGNALLNWASVIRDGLITRVNDVLRQNRGHLNDAGVTSVDIDIRPGGHMIGATFDPVTQQVIGHWNGDDITGKHVNELL